MGLQSRDFIHVSDIVEAILNALESDTAVGQIAQHRDGSPDRSARSRRAARLEASVRTIAPDRQATYRAGDIRHCFADPTRARELLGFTARVRTRGRNRRARRVGEEPDGRDLVEAATRRAHLPRPRALRRFRHARPRDHRRLDERGEVAAPLSDDSPRASGGLLARSHSRRQRVKRRHVRAGGEGVSGGASRPLTNRGFAHANNRGLMTADARYVALPQPRHRDSRGHIRGARRALDARPDGRACRRASADRRRRGLPDDPTVPERHEGLGRGSRESERFPFRASWMGERELDLTLYDREVDCDWTSGSFMIARREAMESAGFMDERFFIYSEEPDLCLRMKQRRLGRQAPSSDDDPSSRRQGWAKPEDRRRRKRSRGSSSCASTFLLSTVSPIPPPSVSAFSSALSHRAVRPVNRRGGGSQRGQGCGFSWVSTARPTDGRPGRRSSRVKPCRRDRVANRFEAAFALLSLPPPTGKTGGARDTSRRLSSI